MIIDSHQHFWDLDKCEYSWLIPEYGPIYASFTPEDLKPLLKDSGIDKTVVVQAADTVEDTDYMLNAAANNQWIAGVVAWLPLIDPVETAKSIAKFAHTPVVKGIRHLIHEEKDPDWVIQSTVIESLKLLADAGLTFDLVSLYPLHLLHIHTLVKEIPHLKIVVDHLAKPAIATGEIASWQTDMAEIAQYPNVFVKLSGLSTAANPDWTTEDLVPVFETVLSAFGASRIMYGSDWPVSILAGGYKVNYNSTLELIAGLSEQEQAQIMGETARNFYNLD